MDNTTVDYRNKFEFAMDLVPMQASSGGCVLPPNAMGYRTPDGHTIVAWDCKAALFYLDNGETRTHGEVTFGSGLTPSTQGCTGHFPPIGRYATSPIAGDCRVQRYNTAGALVRTSTRTMVVALDALATISMHDRVRVDDLHVLLDANTAFVFRNVETIGGTMGFVDHLMGLLADRGVSATGDIEFYERLSHRCILRPLRVRSCRHLTIEARGTFAGATEATGTTTCVAAVMHSAAVDLLDMNPWMAGWSIQRLWTHLGFRSARAPDSTLIRAPWALASGVMTLVDAMPHTVRALAIAPEAFLYGVRSGEITARSGGKYTMRDTEVTCRVDMRDMVERIARCRDQLSSGDHDLRALLPGCPDALLLEWFGEDYNCTTGMCATN